MTVQTPVVPPGCDSFPQRTGSLGKVSALLPVSGFVYEIFGFLPPEDDVTRTKGQDPLTSFSFPAAQARAAQRF